jgi:HEAT repeat protein
MSREQLHALAADVDRLLVAGGTLAAGDEGLARRARGLGQLGQKVPVLAQIAEAAQRVTGAGPAQATPALLDLLLIVRQLRAGLTTAGVEGALEPVEPSGPWATNTPAQEVYALVEAVAGSGSGRLETLKDAMARGVVADLRLVQPLLDGLEDGYGELADLVAEQALPALGTAVLPELRRSFHLSGKSVDARRLAALCRIDPTLGAELCRSAVREGSAVVRQQALKDFAAVAPPEEVKGVALGILAGKAPGAVRAAAIKVLGGELGPAAKEAVSLLEQALRDKDYAIKYSARDALGKIGRPAVDALVAALHDADELVRWCAAWALRDAGPQAAAAVPALLEATADRSERVRLLAVEALGEIGPPARAALPHLERLLADKVAEVQLLVAAALLQIGGDQRRPWARLTAALKHKDRAIRFRAVWCLGRVARKAKAALPVLLSALEDKDDSVLSHVYHALAELGPPAEVAVPALLPALKDERAAVRAGAAAVLRWVGREAQAAVGALTACLEDPDKAVRERAAEALAAIQGQA